MVENKRKKFHDKDKYYRLAKEQGLRSRAAFKLTQINRKFQLLEKSRGVLDLCAAPGGWTQIAARTCQNHVPIVAVDILPIRPIRNVTTLIGDITTDKCKSDIKRAVANHDINVVLHDGAPNVGADYGKDAYEQNEITLHALKCATQHLSLGGYFVTKIYRSRDYAKMYWVLQQLFDTVSAFKPAASRQQSAEIFIVCEKYKAPLKLDPKLLDPKYVFESVEGETTGGSGQTALSVFDKNYDKPKRKRGGYDMEHLDAAMRHLEPVSVFVKASLKEAIQILSSSTGLVFTSDCSFFLHHPFTTCEIKECLSDLQVLSRTDFKGLLNWRTKMQDALSASQERDDASDGDTSDTNDLEAPASDAEQDSEKEEEEIQKEILEMRQRRQREKKRRKKKERAIAAKRRKHAALGMDLNAIDVPDHDKIFSLASITTKGALLAASEVNLDQMTDEQIFRTLDNDDDEVVVGDDLSDTESSVDENEALLAKRERNLDGAYNQYLQLTKDGTAKSGTKMAKRSKKVQRQKVLEEASEDQEMALTGVEHLEYDARTYTKMLSGISDHSDDDSSGEEDDGFDADPMTPEEHVAQGKTDENPLIHRFADEPKAAKTARWFSNPLFASIRQSVQSMCTSSVVKGDEESKNDSNVKSSVKLTNINTVSAYDVISSMPKTDKQIRHEKRLKQMERDERKKTRLAKLLAKQVGESEKEFLLAPADESDSDHEPDKKLEGRTTEQRKKILEAHDLIKAGIGTSFVDDAKDTDVEIVSQEEHPLPVIDNRKYDSEHEDYDSDDHAETLALGTMLLRRSKEKAFVDASYNRYAWNDPSDLPDWFVDNERKHYRPQLPIPAALIAKMKEKMMILSQKPIAKVAEARARKGKRAKTKLAAAKKQAEAVTNSSEMSEAMKLKAISKALQGQNAKRPGKTYVVAKKGRGTKGAKGTKVVDKRMKNDKRALNRVEAKKKNGKQNKLVGSKKRRNHK